MIRGCREPERAARRERSHEARSGSPDPEIIPTTIHAMDEIIHSKDEIILSGCQIIHAILGSLHCGPQ